MYHGGVFLAHFDCADDEVQFDLRQAPRNPVLVVRQRVVAAYLVVDPQQNGTDVSLQVGTQLRVAAKIIGVVLVNTGQRM